MVPVMQFISNTLNEGKGSLFIVQSKVIVNYSSLMEYSSFSHFFSFVLFVYRPSVILGVTNPFFAKTLQHWPHIIRIGDLKPAGKV